MLNPLKWKFRVGYFVMTIVTGAMLGYAYYAQFVLKLEPCPLCILQRIAFIAFFVVCLLATLHGPSSWGKRVYAVLASLSAMAGILVAGRHVWLQHLPADQVPACGPGLGFMLDAFPLSKTLKMVFTGSGECAKVDWSLMGLSMPEWTLISFVLLYVGVLYFGFKKDKKRWY